MLHGRRKVLLSLAAVLIGSVAAVVLMEVGLRIAGIGYGNAPVLSDPVLHHVHPRNYRFLSHKPGGEYGGFTVFYDSAGLVADPDHELVYDPKRHKRMIALMGDSFVEAYQVPYRNSFAGRLNQAAVPDVFFQNYGVASYSPVLHTLLWDRKVVTDNPVHVFLMVYSNDVDDDHGYTKQSIRSADRRVVAVPGPADFWLVHQLRKSYLFRLIRKAQLTAAYMYQNRGERKIGEERFVEDATAISKLTGEYILDVAEKARRTGAKFTLLAVPSKAEAFNSGDDAPQGSFSDSVRKWAQRNGIDYVDLNPAFRSYYAGRQQGDPQPFFKVDIHFNEIGHALVAQEIAKRFPAYFGT